MEERPCEEVVRELFDRIEKSYESLEEFAQKANVPVSFLDALKRGDWSSMPEAVYVKGFLKNIAHTLGIEEEELVSSLSSCIAMRAKETEVTAVSVKRRSVSVASGLFVIVVVLVAMVAALLYLKGAFVVRDVLKPRVEAPLAPKEYNATEAASFAAKNATGNATAVSERGEYSVVEVEGVSGRSWYRWSGDETKEGFVNRGQRVSFRCSSNCTLKLGNPKAVRITFNGNTLVFPFNRPCLFRVSAKGIELLAGNAR